MLFSDPTLGFHGQLDKVEQLKKEIPNVHVLDQFANAANPEAHFKWTGNYLYKGPSNHIRVINELTYETLAAFFYPDQKMSCCMIHHLCPFVLRT